MSHLRIMSPNLKPLGDGKGTRGEQVFGEETWGPMVIKATRRREERTHEHEFS